MNKFFFNVGRLLIDPNGKWAHAFKQQFTRQQIFRQYMLPLLVLYGVCAVAGGLLFTSRLQTSVGLVVVDAIVHMATMTATVFLTAYIVNETAPNFGLPYHFDRVFMLVSFSWTPIVLVSAFTGLFPFLDAFKILFLYALYIAWTAMPHVPELKADKRVSYAATVACLSWILYAMFNIIGLNIGHSIL